MSKTGITCNNKESKAFITFYLMKNIIIRTEIRINSTGKPNTSFINDEIVFCFDFCLLKANSWNNVEQEFQSKIKCNWNRKSFHIDKEVVKLFRWFFHNKICLKFFTEWKTKNKIDSIYNDKTGLQEKRAIKGTS